MTRKTLQVLFATAALLLPAAWAQAQKASPGGTVEVMLCDGETKVQVGSDTVGDTAGGQQVAAALMAQWTAKNPDIDWVMKEAEAHTIVPPADNSDLVYSGQGEAHAYGRFTDEDVQLWARETTKLVTQGSNVFHNPDLLGSTVSVSCDMCHPDAANTHPETYPKFQTQLGRVALLRDMINWCLQHPVRAQPMDTEDPRMRALEAYIYGQRKGKELAYGKH